MFFRAVIVLSLLQMAAVASPCTNYTHNGLDWTDRLRMNQVQVVGTHNSYHIEAQPAELEAQRSYFGDNVPNYWYSHPAFAVQFDHQQVRSLEIDILADPEGGNYARPLLSNMSGLPYPDNAALLEPGTKVIHVPDFDIHASVSSFVDALRQVKTWVDAHPEAVPIPIMIEFKVSEARAVALGGASAIPWTMELLDVVDKEIRSVFPPEQLVTPDDVRRPGRSLEESVLRYGWPDLDSARGRVLFFQDNGPDHVIRQMYSQDRPSLEGRVMFTNAAPGSPDCAFQKLNDPSSEELAAHIQEQVALNYWVRTRADVPIETVLECSTEMRDYAFKSGAQIVSTDYPVYGPSSRWFCDYACQLPRGKVVVCNPVNGPEGCDDDALEVLN